MRAAIYTRISEDDGTALGVARQEVDARGEAEERGWEVVGVYVDNDVSATRSKVRPEFQRLLRDVRSGHVEAVLIWDTDRLTRSPREGEDLIDLWDSHGLQIVSLGSFWDLSTPNGRHAFRNEIARGKLETEKMSTRLKRKYLQNAEAGKPHGRAPYGMMRVEGRDIPDPETAPVLRELATRVLAGESLRGIARDLTQRGVPGPGSPTWNSTIIRQALLRPSYAGLRQYQGKVIGETNGEAVFDRDTHDRLVALLTDPSRKQNHRGREPLYLLSGIAKCGLCGGTMRSQVGHMATTKRGGTKRQPPSYGCSVCFKVRRQREPVDAVVEALVIRRLSDPKVLAELFVKGDPEAALQAQEQMAAIDAKLALAADDWEADRTTHDQYVRSTATLRAKREAAEAQLRAAAPNDRLEPFSRGDVQQVWDAAPMLARREVVQALLEVTINPQGPGKPFDPHSIRFPNLEDSARL